MPGADSRHSQIFFAHLSREEVKVVAHTHGSASYFAIRPVTWSQGDGIKSMHRVFEAFVKKSFKALWSPFTFSTLLGMYWPLQVLFGDKPMIRIQILGPSKMLVGVSESGWEIL